MQVEPTLAPTTRWANGALCAVLLGYVISYATMRFFGDNVLLALLAAGLVWGGVLVGFVAFVLTFLNPLRFGGQGRALFAFLLPPFTLLVFWEAARLTQSILTKIQAALAAH